MIIRRLLHVREIRKKVGGRQCGGSRSSCGRTGRHAAGWCFRPVAIMVFSQTGIASMDEVFEERRCVELDGRKACVSLENDFWECIEQIAASRGTTFSRLVAQVVGDSAKSELSAILRVFVLAHFRHDAGTLEPDVPESSADADGFASEVSGRKRFH
jgi:predicted DNA-binding ribbon-helix-helix protein